VSNLKDRLDRIRERITSAEFLQGRGLGNEVPFYAFDYPPGAEPQVDEHIEWLVDDLTRKERLSIGRVNLLELVVDQIKARGLYEKAVAMEQVRGVPALLNALKGSLDPRKLAEAVIAKFSGEHLDVLIVTGVGAAYPMVRTHTLLNNLQPLIGDTPVVLMFPGRFSGALL
jgi:hypothetical protein